MEEPAVVTVSSVFSGMQEVFTLLLTMFSNVINTITGNPLLYVPCAARNPWYARDVCYWVVRRLGIKGVSSSGGRRRGRRRA